MKITNIQGKGLGFRPGATSGVGPVWGPSPIGPSPEGGGGGGSASFDISTASYDSKSWPAAPSTITTGVHFRDNGFRYFVSEYNDGGGVYAFNLSTAWDVSTALYSFTHSYLGDVSEPQVHDIDFNDDGTKMFTGGYATDSIREYALSSAWNASTASYTRDLNTGAQDVSLRGFNFSRDGTKLYMVGGASDTVYQYDLTTGFDLSSASYSGKSLLVQTQDTVPQGVFISDDGGTLWYAGATAPSSIYQYSLSTPYDLSTATYDNLSLDVSPQGAGAYGLFYQQDEGKLYIAGYSAADAVYQYTFEAS